MVKITDNEFRELAHVPDEWRQWLFDGDPPILPDPPSAADEIPEGWLWREMEYGDGFAERCWQAVPAEVETCGCGWLYRDHDTTRRRACGIGGYGRVRLVMLRVNPGMPSLADELDAFEKAARRDYAILLPAFMGDGRCLNTRVDGLCAPQRRCEACCRHEDCPACLDIVREVIDSPEPHICEPRCETCQRGDGLRAVVKCNHCHEVEACLAGLTVIETVADHVGVLPEAARWRQISDDLFLLAYECGEWIATRTDARIRSTFGFAGFEWCAINRTRGVICASPRLKDIKQALTVPAATS